MSWIPVETGHEIAIVENKIVARNDKGKQLKSVPAKVKKTDEFEKLNQTLSFLKNHDEEAGQTVENWMQRGLPVPVAVIREVWPDQSWRSWLLDLIVTDADGTVGFLRDASADGLGLVDLDGETVTINPITISFPHPALLDDLQDLREFAVELNVEQRLPQLFREAFTMPVPPPADSVTSLSDWADGHFEQLRFATSRAHSAGAKMSGGSAVISTYENGQRYTASYWLGSENPMEETWTGELMWLGQDNKTVPVNQVPPVAYSEGIRLATYVYAGRTVKEDQ